jgi:nucleotide-binding universal stress UspA family protein
MLPRQAEGKTHCKEATMKVVIGYDGSDAAKRALRRAAELAGDETVTVVSVASQLSGPVRGIQPYWPQEIENRRANLEEARTLLLEQGKQVHAVEGRGDPGTLIAEVGDRAGADVIVVGTRGQNVLGRALRGSVSTKVLRRSDRDVLVIR